MLSRCRRSTLDECCGVALKTLKSQGSSALTKDKGQTAKLKPQISGLCEFQLLIRKQLRMLVLPLSLYHPICFFFARLFPSPR